MILQQSTLITILLTLLQYLCDGEIVCSSVTAASDQSGCNQVDQVCKDAAEMPTMATCLAETSLNVDEDLSSSHKGCKYTLKAFRPTPVTTELWLNITPVFHSNLEYNLTVSWDSLNQTTIPANSTFELRLFDNTSTPLKRRICSPYAQISEGPPVWLSDSFDGLVISRQNVAAQVLVELTILAPNESKLIVMSTRFKLPCRCLDVIPVSPYHCISSNNLKPGSLRKLPVINLSYTLTQVDNVYRGRLVWQKNPEVDQYKIPLTYFVTLYNNKSSTFSTAFHTNQTEISISPLEPSREYFIKVQPFMHCSKDCGIGELYTLLSTPSSAPCISHVLTISSSEIEVAWNKIPDLESNGIILGYDVLYNATNYNESVNTKTTNLTITLSGLRANTTYEVFVRAFTSVGGGPYSLGMSNRTLPVNDHSLSTETVTIVVPSTLCALLIAVAVLTFSLIIFLVVKKKKSTVIKTAPREHESFSLPFQHVVPVVHIDKSMTLKSKEQSVSTSSSVTMSLADLSVQSETDSQFINSLPSDVDVLLVVAKGSPQRDNLLQKLTCTLSQFRGSKGEKVNVHFPGLDKELVRLSAPDYLNEVIRQSRDLCFLCVVNKGFLEEWSGKKPFPDSLVYSVSRYLIGKRNQSQLVSTRVLVLYTQENDMRCTPHTLNVCKSCAVDDTPKIYKYVFQQPDFHEEQLASLASMTS